MNINDIIHKDNMTNYYKSCSLGGCSICYFGLPKLLHKKKNWGNQLYVSMFIISKHKGNEWVKLNDLYSFFLSHNNVLQLKGKNNKNIIETIQDTLNHREYFISSPKVVSFMKCSNKIERKNGYWALLFDKNPYNINELFIIKKIIKKENINLKDNHRISILIDQYTKYINHK